MRCSQAAESMPPVSSRLPCQTPKGITTRNDLLPGISLCLAQIQRAAVTEAHRAEQAASQLAAKRVGQIVQTLALTEPQCLTQGSECRHADRHHQHRFGEASYSAFWLLTPEASSLSFTSRSSATPL